MPEMNFACICCLNMLLAVNYLPIYGMQESLITQQVSQINFLHTHIIRTCKKIKFLLFWQRYIFIVFNLLCHFCIWHAKNYGLIRKKYYKINCLPKMKNESHGTIQKSEHFLLCRLKYYQFTRSNSIRICLRYRLLLCSMVLKK